MKAIQSTIAPLLLLLLPLAACGNQDGDAVDEPGTGSEPGGTITHWVPADPRLVATWSEGQHRDQAPWLRAHLAPQILEGEEAKAFVADLPESLADEAEELLAVDLDELALLVAGFNKCGNAGQASVSGSVVTYEVRRIDKRNCVWAPTRIQVFTQLKGLRLEQAG